MTSTNRETFTVKELAEKLAALVPEHGDKEIYIENYNWEYRYSIDAVTPKTHFVVFYAAL